MRRLSSEFLANLRLETIMNTVAAKLRNETDLAAYWMPFTANRQFKADPRMLVSASGMYFRAPDGREILDRHGRPVVRQRRARTPARSQRRSSDS